MPPPVTSSTFSPHVLSILIISLRIFQNLVPSSYTLPLPLSLLSYIRSVLCVAFLSFITWPVRSGFLALSFRKEDITKMSKAGPLTGLISKNLGPAETPAGNNSHKSAVQALTNAESFQPRGELGPRIHSDELVIGLALGSPRQNRLPDLPPGDRDRDVFHVGSSPESPANMLRNACEIHSRSQGIKRKGSKWRSLGLLFGRGEVRSASPFRQLDPRQQSEPAKQSITQDSLETNLLCRKWADSNHGKKVHQVDPSACMSGEASSGFLRRNSSRRRGLRRRKVEDPQPEVLRVPAKHAGYSTADNLDPPGEQQKSRMPGPSLLEVEIPCVELERYSVMFGDVLKPQIQQSKPQLSLLARRQAQLEELHPVAKLNSEVYLSTIMEYYKLIYVQQPFDLDLPKPIRADSCSSKSSKSPSFQPRPSTPPLLARSPKLLQEPSPLNRSVTAPSHHLFPPRPAIRKTKSQDQEHNLTRNQNSEDIPWNPTFRCRQAYCDPLQLSANSTTTRSFECVECPGYSYPNLETDPLTPTKIAAQEFSRRAFPARTSSMKISGLTGPRYRHKEEDTEISVARKISISRRQPQFLVPKLLVSPCRP